MRFDEPTINKSDLTVQALLALVNIITHMIDYWASLRIDLTKLIGFTEFLCESSFLTLKITSSLIYKS